MTETDADKILRLERSLRLAEAERDEFAADIERLCLASGGVAKLENATERAYNAEAETRKLRLELANVTSERDAAHAALAIAGDERAELSQELSQLRRQLETAQSSELQLRGALEDSQLTCEGLKTQARELQTELEAARHTLEEDRTAREGLQSQLQTLQAEAEALRKQGAARDQAESKELIKLRKTVAQLEEAANLSRTQLSEVQAEAMHTHKLLKQAHKIEDQLSTQVQQLQASLAAAKQAQQPSTPRKSGEGASDSASPQPQPPALPPPDDRSRSGPADSPAPSQRTAAARALTASSAAAVTVTAAEATTPVVATDAGAAASCDAVSPGADALAAAEAAVSAAKTETEAAMAALATAQLRVKELEGQLAAARDELEQERAGQSDEREQLQVLRTMVHDFKIKLAQATQEKVEALMRAASVTQEAQQQMQQAAAAAAGGNSSGGIAGGAAGGGGGFASSSIPILQRIGSTLSASARERSEAAAQHSRRASLRMRQQLRLAGVPVDKSVLFALRSPVFKAPLASSSGSGSRSAADDGVAPSRATAVSRPPPAAMPPQRQRRMAAALHEYCRQRVEATCGGDDACDVTTAGLLRVTSAWQADGTDEVAAEQEAGVRKRAG